jgi:hypothetical protein
MTTASLVRTLRALPATERARVLAKVAGKRKGVAWGDIAGRAQRLSKGKTLPNAVLEERAAE